MQMMATGAFLAERLRAKDLDAAINRMTASHSEASDLVLRMSRDRFRWACEWHNNGYPRVGLGHRHAAALMATSTKSESIPDVRAPWDAFLIDVPSGLLGWPSEYVARHPNGTETRHERTLSFPHALVRVDGAGGVTIIPVEEEGRPLSLIQTGSVAELGDFSHREPSFLLLGRLVLGVCMETTCATFKGNRGVPIGPRPVQRDPRTGEPKTWTFQLSRDVKVDCREVVKAYARGSSQTSPSVQSLVRGHWRRQPCGKSGSERKNIFVEPYWRGPEEAHISLRQHKLVERSDQPVPLPEEARRG